MNQLRLKRYLHISLNIESKAKSFLHFNFTFGKSLMDLNNKNILDVYLFPFSTTNAMVFYLICGTWGKVFLKFFDLLGRSYG